MLFVEMGGREKEGGRKDEEYEGRQGKLRKSQSSNKRP